MVMPQGAIKGLHNAMGVGGCQISLKNATKMYGSTLRGSGWVSIFQKKSVM